MFDDLSKYDVFHSNYYHGARYAGNFEMPIIEGTDEVPDKLIRFSDDKSKRRDDQSAWVAPYEHDIKLEPMWHNAFRYMDRLLQHPGIISWDFSMYRIMPWGLQFWNCYRSRLIGSLYERCGGICIPNLRPRVLRGPVYDFDGLPTHSTIAMSTHGCIKHCDDRAVFTSYVEAMVPILHPKTIVVHGSAPDDVFRSAIEDGAHIIAFQSEFAKSRQPKEGI